MPSKFKLNVEHLAVDSFATSPRPTKPGTVFAEQCTCPTACTCPGCPTCDASCNGTCGATCGELTCAASCNGSCDFSCNYTDCECGPPTCLQTLCGREVCCA